MENLDFDELNIFDKLRWSVQPVGTEPISKIRLTNYGYYDTEHLCECIDELQRKSTLAIAGIEDLSQCDKFVFNLLLGSSGIKL